jgi:hypothetical protein
MYENLPSFFLISSMATQSDTTDNSATNDTASSKTNCESSNELIDLKNNDEKEEFFFSSNVY